MRLLRNVRLIMTGIELVRCVCVCERVRQYVCVCVRVRAGVRVCRRRPAEIYPKPKTWVVRDQIIQKTGSFLPKAQESKCTCHS
jgi:hypothetical protein